MEKWTKRFILVFFLAIFIMSFVSALEVECTSASQCSSNELCFNYECVQAGAGGTGEEDLSTNQNNNSISSALIITIGIIIGLIILGWLIRRRNK